MAIYVGLFAYVDSNIRGVVASVQIPILIQNPELRKQVLSDPWGRRYIYRQTEGALEILTLGRDGKPGGSGEDSDISSKFAGYLVFGGDAHQFYGMSLFGAPGVLMGFWLARVLMPFRNAPIRDAHKRS